MAETRSRGFGNYQVEGKTKYKEEDIVFLEECLKKNLTYNSLQLAQKT